MIRQDEIALVIDSQRETFLKQDSGFTRDALTDMPVADSFATIITGIQKYFTFAVASQRLSGCCLSQF